MSDANNLPAQMTIDEFVAYVDRPAYNNMKPIFGVEFEKANGEYRKMSARRGVTKGVKNDTSTNGSWNRVAQDKAHQVLTCYDMNKVDETKPVEESKGAHRRIPLTRLKKVKLAGTKYTFNEETGLLIKDDTE